VAQSPLEAQVPNTEERGPIPSNWRKVPDYTRTVSPSLVIGFGLQWAWMYAVLYSSFPAFFVSDAVAGAVYYPFTRISILVFVCTLILMATFIDRITFIIRWRKLQVSMAAAMCLGTALLAFSELFLLQPLVILAEVINGVTGGFMFLIWSEAYRRRETTSIVANTIPALMFAFVLFGFTAGILPEEISSGLYCIMPLVGVFCLESALHGAKTLKAPQPYFLTETGKKIPDYGFLELPSFRRLKVRRSTLMLRIGLPSLLFGLAFGPLQDETFTTITQLSILSADSIAPMILAALIAFALILMLALLNRTDEYDAFYRFLLPILVLMIFFTGFLSDGFAATLFFFASYICFEFMIWVEFCELSRRYRISPILITGFGRAAVMIGMFFSTMLFDYLAASTAFAFEQGVLNTGIIVLLVFGYFLLPRENDIREMAIIEPEAAEANDPNRRRDNAAARRTRFVERCEKVANTYLLSNRETDVFYLLAKGRNAAYIAENLFISEGTVHTHTWRIYRKLNIHSQQELINLVDNVELSQPTTATNGDGIASEYESNLAGFKRSTSK
jgi:DNA-binding CsgD family transcriptional regulator